MGKWVVPKSKEGQRCVVKHLKNSYTWKQTDWDTTQTIYKEAEELATIFNNSTGTDRPITFTHINVMRCQKSDPTSAIPRVNEYVIVEDYIPGRYVKWCNNYGGWTTDSTMTMQAFVHWSWYYTRGQIMAADLQGVRYIEKYILTDPAILSLRPGTYGCTDMGPEGMALMLLMHTCNSFCSHLPKPTEWDLLSCVTQEELEVCKAVVYSIINNPITYTWELMLSADSRWRLAAKLQEIATKHEKVIYNQTQQVLVTIKIQQI